MSESLQQRFARFQRSYRERDMPWDAPLPPPEVIDLAARLPPGRALDLGCGAGRTCVYLAAAGWQIDGVDFVPEAIALAEERVRAAGVAERVRLHTASVTKLDFLAEPYDLAIDVGCMHVLEGDDLRAYAAEVARLVRPGGLYLLFAHLRTQAESALPASIPESVVVERLRDAFRFEQVEHGTTQVGAARGDSAWFYLRRRATSTPTAPQSNPQ